MSVKTEEMFLSRKKELKQLKIFAHKVQILVPAEATGGVFSLIEQLSPPGEGIPPHIHAQEDETFIIIEGEIDLEYGGKKMKAKAGDTFFLPRLKPHGYVNNGKLPCRVMVIISPGGFEQFFEDVQAIDSTNPANIGKVAELLEKKYATTFLKK